MKRIGQLLILWLPIAIYAQQTGDLNSNTVNSSVSSNNVDTTNNYNGAGSGSPTPPPSAIAPTYMFNGSESCLISSGGSIQVSVMGMSMGNYRIDYDCELRRDAKALKEMGMAIASVSLLCSDPSIFRSMLLSGTPCPIVVNGELIVGRVAYLYMKRQPELFISDYNDDIDLYNLILGIGYEAPNTNRNINLSISDQYRTVTNRFSRDNTELN
jgi:hypothetical protein